MTDKTDELLLKMFEAQASTLSDTARVPLEEVIVAVMAKCGFTREKAICEIQEFGG
jgi:hypothetical protein